MGLNDTLNKINYSLNNSDIKRRQKEAEKIELQYKKMEIERLLSVSLLNEIRENHNVFDFKNKLTIWRQVTYLTKKGNNLINNDIYFTQEYINSIYNKTAFECIKISKFEQAQADAQKKEIFKEQEALKKLEKEKEKEADKIRLEQQKQQLLKQKQSELEIKKVRTIIGTIFLILLTPIFIFFGFIAAICKNIK